MITVYDWLVNQGLWRDVIAAVVGGIVGYMLAWRPARKLHLGLFRIYDQLDTKTPGGLTDLLHEIRGATAHAGAQPPPDVNGSSQQAGS